MAARKDVNDDGYDNNDDATWYLIRRNNYLRNYNNSPSYIWMKVEDKRIKNKKRRK